MTEQAQFDVYELLIIQTSCLHNQSKLDDVSFETYVM